MVEQHQVGAGRSHDTLDLLQFALSYQRGGVGPGTALHQRCRNLRSCAARQFLELPQRLFEINIDIAGSAVPGLSHACGKALVRIDGGRVPGQPGRRSQSPPLSRELHRDQHGKLFLGAGTQRWAGRAQPLRLCLNQAHTCPLGLVASDPVVPGLAASAGSAQSPATSAVSATAAAAEACPPCAVRTSGFASTRPSACGATRPLTTVEMACLKINCSWALFSSSTEYLSRSEERR